jgi:multiple sugar transport system ATP-binding protein
MGDITFDQVWKVYPDGTEAVRAVDLEIEDGSLMVLVGPSGCGKTTLLRMVAGLEEVTAGAIRIGDQRVNEVPAKNRDIAMVFQNYALYPHMNVFDNQAFGLRLRRMPKPEIRERVSGVAQILGLVAELAKKPGQLSGGQRQRVAMGRAIVRQPQAFLMDEPLSNLDAKLRVQMRSEISRMQRDLQTTMIYVTHDQTEAMTMGTKVAVMRKGDLQQVDAPEVLFNRPANLFVAGFIGSPAMNLVNATVSRTNGHVFVEFAGERLRVDDEALDERPALSKYDGRPVVLGIRPDATEDATIVHEAPEDRRIAATAELRETVGSEAFVHFSLDVPPVVTEDTKQLAEDAGVDALPALDERGKTPFVARLHARSRAREGERMHLFIDTRELHFFDPETGDGIYG